MGRSVPRSWVIPLWGRPISGSFGDARRKPGVCRGSVSGPMMGDLRVALRTGPSGSRLLRESDPRSRGLHPVQSDAARSKLHPGAPGFDGAGSIRHRSQNFVRRWRWLGWVELFKGGLGRGRRVVPFGCVRPCDHQRQAPAIEFIVKVLDFPVATQRRLPTV